jgi:hypothetical protein
LLERRKVERARRRGVGAEDEREVLSAGQLGEIDSLAFEGEERDVGRRTPDPNRAMSEGAAEVGTHVEVVRREVVRGRGRVVLAKR